MCKNSFNKFFGRSLNVGLVVCAVLCTWRPRPRQNAFLLELLGCQLSAIMHFALQLSRSALKGANVRAPHAVPASLRAQHNFHRFFFVLFAHHYCCAFVSCDCFCASLVHSPGIAAGVRARGHIAFTGTLHTAGTKAIQKETNNGAHLPM